MIFCPFPRVLLRPIPFRETFRFSKRNGRALSVESTGEGTNSALTIPSVQVKPVKLLTVDEGTY